MISKKSWEEGLSGQCSRNATKKATEISSLSKLLVGAKKDLWARTLKRKEWSSQIVDATKEKDLLVEIKHENVVAFERFYQFPGKSELEGLTTVTEFLRGTRRQSTKRPGRYVRKQSEAGGGGASDVV